MTEYGRGTGSEPWRPDDPLYGDRGWNGAQHGAQQEGWEDAYGGQGQYHPQHDPHPQQYQAPQASAHDGQGWDTQDGQYADPHGHQQQHQYQEQYGDPYGGGQYADPYGHQQQYQQHQQYQQYDDPYGDHRQQADPYDGGHQQHQQHQYQEQYGDPYGGHRQHGPPHRQEESPERPDEHDPYGRHTPRRPEQGHRDEPDSGPEPDEETGWDPGPDQGEHAFFADDGDDDSDDGHTGHDGRSGRSRRGRSGKGRNGLACLTVLAVLAGGVGVAGYFAHDFYQDHFAAAPDFSGEGKGETQVEIPEGSSLAQMGAILEKAGVVKSRDAFIEASNANAKAKTIQAGVYMLRKEMSAEAAIEMMLDPSSQNALIIAEGKRAVEIYALIDEKLGLEEGTTEKTAEETDLGLPEWADGNPEGFLFPAKYTVGEKTAPEDLLKKMVERAEREFEKADLAGHVERLGLESPMEVLTVASLVQAEGKYKHDFVKVARVVYNRLKPDNTETNGYLQFDSTYNYAKNQYTLDVPSPSTMAKFDHPYNTYAKKGLPPGPINSPGAEALHAAVEPAEGGWYYFVSITEDNTVFSDTYKEHQKNVEKYEKAQQ
ncbi:endolytic transglycosylase MltG [Streptomyces sp. TRM43335]|uniref:Endolytic murein transglycosylase n=1 Tax=Streptomyces taklimakanensis TaxID=2569853 RepID=A0A6G2B7T1_9ACTN|nr:endolytic transglycosylase MltG [Streptomyces taklimakanensis]MTE18186.1 endolytic transglycosylase MltG [Streptomyces taklimakanensis]